MDGLALNPFTINGPTCISFSGGRTSAYMLHRVLESNAGLPTEAMVLFANTGKEDEATLEFVRDCGRHWAVTIHWVEYRLGLYGEGGGTPLHGVVQFDNASRAGEPFEAVIKQRGGVLPNGVARYCSSEMKTRTMHRFLRACGWTEWDAFIGIRADEPRRVAKFRANSHPETKSEELHMPLAVAGIGAQDVAAFWRAQPFDLGLPNMNGKTMHGNCDLCFLKPPAQILSLIAEKPGRAIWWAAQEKKAEAFAITRYGARFADDRPGYAQMAAYAADQIDAFGHDEEAIPCFCGD